MQERCAGCGRYIGNDKEIGSSQLYNPGADEDIDLCMACFDAEEIAVEEEGTNNLPDLLAQYRRNLVTTD